MLWIALKTFLFKTSRSYYAVTSVALCVMIVVTSFSVTNGLLWRFQGITGRVGTSELIVVLNGNAGSMSESILDEDFKIQDGSIYALSPEIFTQAYFSSEGKTTPVTLIGVEFKSFSEVRSIRLIDGRPIDSGSEVMVGEQLAKRLGLEVGSEISLASEGRSVKAQVVGVFDSSPTSPSPSPYDHYMVTAFGVIRDLRPDMRSKISLLEVKLRGDGGVDQAVDRLRSTYPNLKILLQKDMKGFVDRSLDEIIILLWVVSITIFTIALLAVYHTMLTIVQESRWEIGLLRALGAKRQDVLKVFLTQALILSSLGGLIGVVLAVLVSNGVTIAVFLLMPIAYVQPVPDPAVIAISLALSLVVGLLGGAIPSIRASRTMFERV
ncbi:MAG: ABC transporter permease [Candidatus Geothermarchaeales archaeon]